MIAFIKEEGSDLDPVIGSSCMYAENETSEKCILSIIETVSTYVSISMIISAYVYLFRRAD